ncbi:M23 family metallopeptidase [Crocinitomicaceae bacterium]|nr:M23 family metallopeptidase [Crocinitomicaceae bacterium]
MKNQFFVLLILLSSCNSNDKIRSQIENKNQTKTIVNYDTIQFTNGFDFPVGELNANGYYNAQKFKENNHLGDDWNGTGGGNTDLGDPIHAIADGYVSFSENVNGGWGNVIRIIHFIDSNKQVESLYAHCDKRLISAGEFVEKGTQIGTIGTNNGQYLAHLHFEIRNIVNLPIGGGYSSDTEGYLDPTEFINRNR